jgi:hypothetical protein
MEKATILKTLVRVVCRSLSPMLQDATEEYNSLIDPEQIQRRNEVLRRMPRRQRAETKLYRGQNGELGFPFEMLNAALAQIMDELKNKGIPPAILHMPYREFVPFDPESLHPDQDHPTDPKKNIRQGWLPDVRMARGKPITRAKFPTWGFTAFCYIESISASSIEAVRQLFSRAGVACGLGAYRPPNGPFGAFTVVDISVEPNDAKPNPDH